MYPTLSASRLKPPVSRCSLSMLGTTPQSLEFSPSRLRLSEPDKMVAGFSSCLRTWSTWSRSAWEEREEVGINKL